MSNSFDILQCIFENQDVDQRVPAHSLYFGSFMKNAEIEIFVVLGDYKNNYKKIMV